MTPTHPPNPRTRQHNTTRQVYLGTEHAGAGGKKKGQQQVLFVRGISHSESTQTPMGVWREWMMCDVVFFSLFFSVYRRL
jgi:hypothetical protein